MDNLLQIVRVGVNHYQVLRDEEVIEVCLSFEEAVNIIHVEAAFQEESDRIFNVLFEENKEECELSEDELYLLGA